MWQARHRARRASHDTIGMLSYQRMGAPHSGHADGGCTMLRSMGKRAITTLRKLPMISPKTKHMPSRKRGGGTG